MKRVVNRMRAVPANPYLDPADLAGVMSWEDIEARLIEAARVFRDHKGGAAWAGDAPWHLTRDAVSVADYWSERLGLLALGEKVDPPVARRAIDREAVARADAAMGWLMLLRRDEDRRLVCIVIAQLAGGARQVGWRAVLAAMGLAHGIDGLRKRYERAIGLMCVLVNARKL